MHELTPRSCPPCCAMWAWHPCKDGKTYAHRSGFCLETQHFPDSPNHPEFPSVILNPGEKYTHVQVYKFGIHKEQAAE